MFNCNSVVNVKQKLCVTVQFTDRYANANLSGTKKYSYWYDGDQKVGVGSYVVVPTYDQTEDNFAIARVCDVSEDDGSRKASKYIIGPFDVAGWKARAVSRIRKDSLLKTIEERAQRGNILAIAKMIASTQRDHELERLIQEYEAL